MAHLTLLWVLSLGTIDVRVVLRDGSAMHLKSWVYWLLGRYRCRHRISILQVRHADAMVTVPCIKCGAMLKANSWFGPPVIPANVELTPDGSISGTVDKPRVKGNDMGICVKCGTATQDQSIIGGRWRYECDECCYGSMIRKAEREKNSVRLPKSVERDALNGQNSNGAHDTGPDSPAES